MLFIAVLITDDSSRLVIAWRSSSLIKTQDVTKKCGNSNAYVFDDSEISITTLLYYLLHIMLVNLYVSKRNCFPIACHCVSKIVQHLSRNDCLFDPPNVRKWRQCCTGFPFHLFETVCQKQNYFAIWPFLGLFQILKEMVSF